MIKNEFENSAFAIVDAVLSEEQCTTLNKNVSNLKLHRIGARNLLDFSWCADLAKMVRSHIAVDSALPRDAAAVQCNFFEKSVDQNWLVPLHQDLSIPVREKIDHPDLTGWSEKAGVFFVQPAEAVLQNLVAVRIHLDECGPNDGPLRVVPGSHKRGRISNDTALAERDLNGEVPCVVQKGGALLMKPLLLHASSKASGRSNRRVLHFVFGPQVLPYGLHWQVAI